MHKMHFLTASSNHPLAKDDDTCNTLPALNKLRNPGQTLQNTNAFFTKGSSALISPVVKDYI